METTRNVKKSAPEVQGAGSQGIHETKRIWPQLEPKIVSIAGWSDLKGKAGRKECEDYLAQHPELKQEDYRVYELLGTWVIGR